MAKLEFIRRKSCPICGESKNKHILNVPIGLNMKLKVHINNRYEGDVAELYDKWFSILKCKSCGFLFQKYILDDKSLEIFYTNWIKDESIKKRTEANLTCYQIYSREVSKIPQMLQKKPCEIDVLDWGMGWGYWLLMVKAFGMNPYGYDISKKRQRYAKGMGIDILKELEGRYDFINMDQILEHVPYPKGTLERAYHLLKPNGILHIHVPDARKFKIHKNMNWSKAPYKSLQPFEHINGFTRKTLVHAADNVGFKPIPYPFLFAHRDFKGIFRAIAAKYYNDRIGTNVYFKKEV